jgi:hypothetical protein
MPLELEKDQNRCDWMGCVEVGFLNGVQKTLLNNEGRKNIPATVHRFVFLCDNHFQLGVSIS